MQAEIPAFMQAWIQEQATSQLETPKTPPGDALAASPTGTSKQHKLAKLKQIWNIKELILLYPLFPKHVVTAKNNYFYVEGWVILAFLSCLPENLFEMKI